MKWGNCGYLPYSENCRVLEENSIFIVLVSTLKSLKNLPVMIQITCQSSKIFMNLWEKIKKVEKDIFLNILKQ